jgi:hypothetical protein
LEADHPAEWTWLIHNDTGLKVDPEKKTIVAENEFTNAQVTLLSSMDLHFYITDTFSIPARNWNRKVDQDGNLIDFVDQWHFSAISKEKNPKMRFLAIIQVTPKSGESVGENLVFDEKTNTYSIGEWYIKAEMNSNKSAMIKVEKSDGSAGLVSTDILTVGGKEYKGSSTGSPKLMELVDGNPVFKESIDQIPDAIRKACLRLKDK